MSDDVVDENGNGKDQRVYRVALTGGPCAGKTTSQARISTFFENLGWKVFRVPEAAAALLGGGVKFSDLTEEQSYKFQENLLKTMMQLENTYFDLANSLNQNCLVICDRGVMDASAFLRKEQWQELLDKYNWNNVNLRDDRYNQVVHLVTAAKGAEAFYRLDNDGIRTEGFALARELDDKACQAWVGHPYFDVVDNSDDFSDKVRKVISAICAKVGIDTRDRLDKGSKKRKFLIAKPLDFTKFPPFQDFDVQHDYLISSDGDPQVRIRKRGQNGYYTYNRTVRLPKVNDQKVERRMIISPRDYEIFLAQRDPRRNPVVKTRTCFLWQNQYFQLDVYRQPSNERCKDLIILETFTTKEGDDLVLPDFVEVVKEVTDDKEYSMYNLALNELF